jgi:DNA-binding transcriptional LysR family regulator
VFTTDPDHWAALEVRHLRAFIAVADAGSFARAARALGYSQPGISHQILALERIVGAPLFVRSAGGRSPLKLTDAGVVLLEHARDLLNQIGVTHTEVRRAATGDHGVLSVVTYESLGVRILPKVLRRFRREHPELRIQVAAITSAEASWAAVEDGEADLALTLPPRVGGPFEVRPLLAEPYALLMARTRPVRRLEELEGKRLLGTSCHSWALIEQRLHANGILPAAIDRFDNAGLVEALVAAGEGVAIVPCLAVNRQERDVSVLALAEVPPRQLVSLTRRERLLTGSLDRLVQFVNHACASLSKELTFA